jgi:hypothetical protein
MGDMTTRFFTNIDPILIGESSFIPPLSFVLWADSRRPSLTRKSPFRIGLETAIRANDTADAKADAFMAQIRNYGAAAHSRLP